MAGILPNVHVANPPSSNNPELSFTTFYILPWLPWTQLGSLLGQHNSGSYMDSMPSCPIPSQVWCLPFLLLPAWQITFFFLPSSVHCPGILKAVCLPAQPLSTGNFIYQSKPTGVRVPKCLVCRCANSCAILGTQINII